MVMTRASTRSPERSCGSWSRHLPTLDGKRLSGVLGDRRCGPPGVPRWTRDPSPTPLGGAHAAGARRHGGTEGTQGYARGRRYGGAADDPDGGPVAGTSRQSGDGSTDRGDDPEDAVFRECLQQLASGAITPVTELELPPPRTSPCPLAVGGRAVSWPEGAREDRGLDQGLAAETSWDRLIINGASTCGATAGTNREICPGKLIPLRSIPDGGWRGLEHIVRDCRRRTGRIGPGS